MVWLLTQLTRGKSQGIPTVGRDPLSNVQFLPARGYVVGLLMPLVLLIASCSADAQLLNTTGPSEPGSPDPVRFGLSRDEELLVDLSPSVGGCSGVGESVSDSGSLSGAGESVSDSGSLSGAGESVSDSGSLSGAGESVSDSGSLSEGSYPSLERLPGNTRAITDLTPSGAIDWGGGWRS